jgi:hypothetical protein
LLFPPKFVILSKAKDLLLFPPKFVILSKAKDLLLFPPKFVILSKAKDLLFVGSGSASNRQSMRITRET